MSSIITYKNLKIVSPTPTADAGLALNQNFTATADHIADTENPHETTAAQVGALPLDGSQPMSGTLDMGGGNIVNIGTGTVVNGAVSASTALRLYGTSDSQNNGHNLNMNDGSGGGGGTLNMDNGNIINCTDIYSDAFGTPAFPSINAFNSVAGSASTAYGWGQASLKLSPDANSNNAYQVGGNFFDMNDGSGAGGGILSMDNGSIYNCTNIYTDAGGTPAFPSFNAFSSVAGSASTAFGWGNAALKLSPDANSNNAYQVAGNDLDMNDGSGAGGGSFSMDGGAILHIAAITFADNSTQTTAATGGGTETLAAVLGVGNNALGININMNDGTGAGGGSFSMDGGGITNLGKITGTNPAIPIVFTAGTMSSVNFSGIEVNMNGGLGGGGSTLNMDGGTIQNCGTIYTSNLASSNPFTLSAPNIAFAGTVTFDGENVGMNASSGSGGGSFSMDGGSITNIQSLSGYENSIFFESDAFINSHNLNLGNGTGVGGATLNADAGTIVNIGAMSISANFATADPHSVGQIWNNGGILTVSAG